MKNPFITSRFDNIYISVPELSLTVEVFHYLSLPSCLLPKKYVRNEMDMVLKTAGVGKVLGKSDGAFSMAEVVF